MHGGLRYLDQREFRLVYEGLAERQRVLENAPHLVRVLPFLVPVMTSGGRVDRRLAPVLGSALWMYDLTGGLRIGKRHHSISVDEAIDQFATSTATGSPARTSTTTRKPTTPRLTLTIARTAVAHGAVADNYAEVVSFERHDGRVVGARIGGR